MNPMIKGTVKSSLKQPPFRLLLIDDDPNAVFLTKDYLEFSGFEVLTASNGAQGIEHLRCKGADLVICDVMMPRMNGYSFLKHVKANPRTKHVPVLFLTAHCLPKDRHAAFEAGVSAYVVKPFHPEELLHQVNVILKQTTPHYSTSLASG